MYDSDADRSSPAWQAAALRAALQPALGQLLEGRVQPLRHYLHPLRCARLPCFSLRLHGHARCDGHSALRRWVKSLAELALMRKSAAASAAAMARCIQLTRPGVSEAFIAATFGARGLRHGPMRRWCWRANMPGAAQSTSAGCGARSKWPTLRSWAQGQTHAPSITRATTRCRWPAHVSPNSSPAPACADGRAACATAGARRRPCAHGRRQRDVWILQRRQSHLACERQVQRATGGRVRTCA